MKVSSYLTVHPLHPVLTHLHFLFPLPWYQHKYQFEKRCIRWYVRLYLSRLMIPMKRLYAHYILTPVPLSSPLYHLRYCFFRPPVALHSLSFVLRCHNCLIAMYKRSYGSAQEETHPVHCKSQTDIVDVTPPLPFITDYREDFVKFWVSFHLVSSYVIWYIR